MADKDINIHVKTPGAPEAKQQLDKTAEGIQNVGASVGGATTKATAASSAFSKFLDIFTGAAILAALKGVVSFFDNMMAKADQAIGKAGEVRKAYEGLFETFGAFDEKSRKEVIKKTEQLLIQSGASAEAGYPTIEAYDRQFKDVMPKAEYDAGLQNALSYAARHGGAATPELISLMRGMEINTASGQSAFMRQVSAGSGASGLTDEDIINALGRGAPTIRAMGWSPERALSSVLLLAQGETGRNKASLPATTLEALSSPNIENAKKLGFSGDALSDFNLLYQEVSKKTQSMPQDKSVDMIRGIYGEGAAKGVYKLAKNNPAVFNALLQTAAGPAGAAADRAEQESYMQTMEAQANQSAARARQIKTQIDSGAQKAAEVRKQGQASIEASAVKHPVRQDVLDKLFWLFPSIEKEIGAYKEWEGTLTPEQRKDIQQRIEKIHKELPSGSYYPFQPAEQEFWFRMSPEERYDSLIKNPGTLPAPAYERSSQSAPVPVSRNYGDTVENWGTNPLGAASQLVQNYYNNTYINQNPPDAQPRCGGGL
jgi:hypothetical protein